MLVNLRVVSINEIVNISHDSILFESDLLLKELVIVVLIKIEIAFQESMIKIKWCQLFKILFILLSESVDHIEKEFFHLVNIVNEDL